VDRHHQIKLGSVCLNLNDSEVSTIFVRQTFEKMFNSEVLISPVILDTVSWMVWVM